jgi:toxin ParE1/3/4
MRQIWEYIALDSRRYATNMLRRIVRSVGRLAEFPNIGRRVPEFGEREEIRELIVQNYRVIYRIGADIISVSAVIHGARDLERALGSRPV